MEQVLTVGIRGVSGEGGLKGRLIVHCNLPYLEVIGRDKRELYFLLQGPDQEVLPAYAEHKVSVSGYIKRHHYAGGTVDVRKYSARSTEESNEVAGSSVSDSAGKLRLLSPGEVETICNPGMSVGVKGVTTIRGRLEYSGGSYYLVVSNAGTRQQVSFTINGNATKNLKKYIGETAVATGVVEKLTGWGGRIEAEDCEPRAPDYPPVARENFEVTKLKISGTTASPKSLVAQLNQGVEVSLAERFGYVWTIEPQMAKRLSLREVALRTNAQGAVREFFFTPRSIGTFEADFFLGKIHNPTQVTRVFRINFEIVAPPGLG